MFHKLMRQVEKKDELGFEFEFTSIEVTQPIIKGRLLSLRWSRHSKTGTTKTTVASSSGRAFWGDDEGLELKATLYR